jgi:hypothetical protein
VEVPTRSSPVKDRLNRAQQAGFTDQFVHHVRSAELDDTSDFAHWVTLVEDPQLPNLIWSRLVVYDKISVSMTAGGDVVTLSGLDPVGVDTILLKSQADWESTLDDCEAGVCYPLSV